MSVARGKCWGWGVFYGQGGFSVEFFAVHDEIPLLVTMPDNVPLLKLCETQGKAWADSPVT